MKTAIGRRAIAIVVAAGLLSGCGSGGGGVQTGAITPSTAASSSADNGVAALKPEDAVARAKAALKSAKSFRMKGDVKDSGKTISLDFKIAGSAMGGTLTMEGAKVELLTVGGKSFIRPDKKFWEQNAGPDAGTMVKLMGNKWAILSAKDKKDFADFFRLADVDELLKPSGTLTMGQTTEIDGVPAVAIDDSGDKLYIATTGEPYPLKMGDKGSDQGQVTFSDFGATFADLKQPPASEVIDFDKLQG